MRLKRLQSAMEYLMTYGWAILIIAVVLGALFQLGVFNAGTFAPRAPPGACQVFRPNGPNSAHFINLEGVCNGELPQYVGVFVNPTTTTSWSSYASASNTQILSGNTATITYWVYPEAIGGNNYCALAVSYHQGCSQGAVLCVDNSSGSLRPRFENWCNDGTPSSGPTIQLDQWNFMAGTLSGTTLTLYLNSYQYPAITLGAPSISSTDILNIGIEDGGSPAGVGMIAGIQIYNTSLSANEIQYLYTEGIGGAPLNLQNIVGWWPLNGNANDYSGNNNNAVPSGVTYTNQWAGGYTPP